VPARPSQQIARGDAATHYAPASDRLDAHLRGIDDALGALGAVVFEHAALPVVGQSAGAAKTTTEILGATIGESFGVGDELFLLWDLPEHLDRTVDAVLRIQWYPTTAEVAKFIRWQLTLLSSGVGDLANGTTGVIVPPDQAYPAVQYEETILSVTLDAATYLAGVADAISVRLDRIASAADPVGRPVVIHASVRYRVA